MKPSSRYFELMSDLREKISREELTEVQANAVADQGYDAWKEEKIKSALKQSEDRSTMIPANKVWERFGFER
ncbi:hypothetical protein HGP14_07605 [Rhizobium sp. P32RR-XVIII]|uniref:hypothetical protein n=1 Tax=Rhizobium sp. P32RR-XVIII TaxID=2726738 RepID=UPI001457289D|nr:hypothetical protein [Rhizobium sp. P32RR-XVIII]NLS03237.1 hypothetical protein [Rhizobium sp. P32RR-XVIII]